MSEQPVLTGLIPRIASRLLVAFFIAVGTNLPLSINEAWAAAPALLSPAELTDLLTQPGVKVKAANMQVVGSGPEVTVMAQKEGAVSERDWKIDAIFLARALIVGAPGQVCKVKVLFSQAGHDGRYVNITDKQIEQYGSGKISPEQFLATLRLVPVDALRAPDVVQGPQYERRLLVWQRIEKLRQAGTGVVPYETLFSEIDNGVKSGKEDPGKKLAFLEGKLAEQEEMVEQARRTARGLGVPASKNSASSNTTSGSASGIAGGALAAARTDSASQSGESVPSDHVRLRSIFNERAESVINLARGKDYKVAEQMSQLKRQADIAFASDRLGQAFIAVRKFEALAKQTTNTDLFGGQNNEYSNNGRGPEGGPGGGPPGNGPFSGRGGL